MKKGRFFSESFTAFAKQKKNLLLLMCAVVGVALVLLPLFFGGEASQSDGGDDSLEEYKLRLEEELSELCSDIYGVGRCRVKISFSSGFRFEYKGSALVEKFLPEIDGVTVLCEGAGSSEVRREISGLISALYGIGQNRICVLKLSS